MKENTQKKLVGLAEKVLTIDESEQVKYVGGAYYIDYDGGDFGQIGNSDRLYLLGSREMYTYACENKLDYYGLNLFEAKDSFFGPESIYHDQHIQKKVFSKYASQVIDYNGPVEVVDDWYAEDIYYVRKGQPGVSGALYFNVSKSGMIFSNEGLTQKLIQIQKDINTQEYPEGFNPDDPGRDPKIDEVMTKIAELNKADAMAADEFLKTHDYGKYQMIYNQNQNIRKSYASQLYSIWHEQGHAGYGYEIMDAERICGVKSLVFPQG